MIEFNITNPIIIYVSIMTSSASTLSSMSWISNSYTLLMLDINEMCLLWSNTMGVILLLIVQIIFGMINESRCVLIGWIMHILSIRILAIRIIITY